MIRFSLALLLFGVSAFAQGYQIPPPLKLEYGNHHILIPQKNKDGPHDFFSDSCQGLIDRTVVHAAIRKGDTLYVVFTCAGPSRGPEASMKRCGGGWEHQINWVSISHGVVTAFQQMDIESCWNDTFGTIDGWKNGILVWGSDRFDTGYTALFDPSAPEKGLQQKETHKNPTS
ncbi:hypothetical protein BH09VER1_BH09VER1_31980 [soil metagenome]